MEHQIYLFGLNHKTAGVEVREAFALGDKPTLGDLLVRGEARVGEALVLSTCNRVEVLVANVPGRVAANGDPWEPMNASPQSIETLLEMSARDMAAGLMDAPWPPVYPKQPNEPPRVAPSRAKADPDD